MLRLMSVVCPDAAVFWWSGDTLRNQRGCLMTYLPTDEGHTGWWAELRRRETWSIAKTLCTSRQELDTYATQP